jgi:hypothetical protein
LRIEANMPDEQAKFAAIRSVFRELQ